jgi:RNA processing factor Prp31
MKNKYIKSDNKIIRRRIMTLKEILESKILKEEDEAPAETSDNNDDFDLNFDDNSDTQNNDNNETNDEDNNNDNSNDNENDEATTDNDNDNINVNDNDENMDDVTKAVDPSSEIEQMVGIVDIQHSSSSTFIDFEDGGQVMFVQPITTLKVDTIKKIIELIKNDVREAYAQQNDEVTGRTLKDTKYWKSIKVIIDAMVESQMTKSDNLNGLIEEVRQLFKILDIK